MLLITEIRFLDERKVSCASSDSGLGCEGQEREEQREETDKRIIRPDDVAVRELLNFDEVTGIMYQDEITHCLSCRKRRMSTMNIMTATVMQIIKLLGPSAINQLDTRSGGRKLSRISQVALAEASPVVTR